MTAISQIVSKKNYRDGFNSRGLLPQRDEAYVNSVMTDPLFVAACKVAEIPVTSRQASKFARKMGSAYKAVETFGADTIMSEAE